MSKKYDIKVGDKYNHLTVLELKAKKNKDGKWLHKCQCDCENKTICYARGCDLVNGEKKSCGCLNNKKYKFEFSSRFYGIWNNMLRRCNNTNDKDYNIYGGRGIKVCNSWKMSFEYFYKDMHESYLDHIYQYGEKDTTLDRIDVNGNYCKENCKWATQIEQSNNRTNNRRLVDKDGTTHTVYEWSRIKGICRSTLSNRINNLGWSDIDALNKPARKINYKLSIKKE